MEKDNSFDEFLKKLPEITSSLLPGYKHIYGLNGFTLQDKPFYKYLPMTRMVQMIEDKQIVFVDPSTWKDPFEKMYATVDCSSHGYSPREDIACMCVSYFATKNEEASWKIYASSSREGISGIDAVRISLDKTNFLNLLERYARDKDCKVYIGKVIYDLKADDIREIYKSSSPFHSLFCPHVMQTEHVLSLLLLKRRAYAYENEIRIFIVKDHLDMDGDLLKIDCDYKTLKMISTLTLAPNEPIDKGVKNYLKTYTNKINASRSAFHKEMFSDLLGIEKTKVKQSLLYVAKKPVSSIE